MNVSHWLLWGFLATLLLTMVLAASQGLGLTRMNLPYMLGTMLTPNRDKAKLYGFMLHVAAGWSFSALYVAIFQSVGWWNWWFGALVGVAHAAFVLVVSVSMLPGLHPRMASEHSGPAGQRALEPPGFLALNYGTRTPVSVVLSHAIFGMILGAFYRG